jgi:predicted dehydrogenase
MSGVVRLGIVGAGRVFERLYLPALRAAPGIELAALADPVPGRSELAGPGVATFPTLVDLLDGATVGAVVVLSPPGSHTDAALLALARELPVLVEKPLCRSMAEVERLRAAGAERLLTPALSRRYWTAYRKAAEGGPVDDLRIAIAVNPAGWGAHAGPADIAEDLVPHVADLARWLTRSDIVDVAGYRRARGVRVDLGMASGARVAARLDVRDAYREAMRADGRARHVGPPSAVESLARRALRREDPPVQAISLMLEDWLSAIGGTRSRGLPSFEDGVATVAAMEQLRAKLGP